MAAFTFSAPFIDGLLTTVFDCATTGELNIGGCPTAPTAAVPVLLTGIVPSGDWLVSALATETDTWFGCGEIDCCTCCACASEPIDCWWCSC